jgi:heptaprenylglyceryl phosphate synthase
MGITEMKARFNGEDADATTSTLAANGTDSFTLGGTLNVQENQIGGQYSGTFQVSVDYN